MARRDAALLLKESGLPVVYNKWPDGSTPTFPCIRYISEGQEHFRADDTRYAALDIWSATLVCESKNDAAEMRIEAAFDTAGIPFQKMADVWVAEERLLQTEYVFRLPS